jgi:hypothetical protein
LTSTESDGPGGPESEYDEQQDAMKDQLRKDVASWSKARSGESTELVGRPAAPAVRPPAARVSRAKAKPAEAAAAAPDVKKPFRMSYDGTTDKDYIAHRIKLGAR